MYAQPVTIREAGVWTASAETALISWDWLRENQGVKDVYEYQNRPLQPTSFTVDAPAKMVEKPVCDATLGKTVDATGYVCLLSGLHTSDLVFQYLEDQ